MWPSNVVTWETAAVEMVVVEALVMGVDPSNSTCLVPVSSFQSSSFGAVMHLGMNVGAGGGLAEPTAEDSIRLAVLLSASKSVLASGSV